MADEAILSVRNLSVGFGERCVVNNVSYDLRPGETLGIVGESGSGKSVSSMAVMGLLPRQAWVRGQALLDGMDLLALSEERMCSVRGRRIAMVFQEPMTSLNPVQRCGEQVAEMLRQHGMNAGGERERVVQLFEEVLLPRPEKIFDSYPHQLSGGQKQRVMIAMALACRPDVLIADEPTTALDVTVQRAILDLLRQLQRKHGIAVVFISHDLGVIAQVADRILVMYRGNVVEQGSAQQVLHEPREPYTRGLLACRPPLDARPRRLPTVEQYMAGEVAAGGDEVPQAEGERQPLVRVENLSVVYPLKKNFFGRATQELRAVDGLTFDILEGETLGLVGESGCGKSTLGRALLRLIETASGSVTYRGQRLDSLSRHQLRALRPRMQIVFQDPYSSLNPRLTIGEAISEPLRVHGGADHGQVLELMQQVGLEKEWYGRYPHQLSGGQRQRVCIARALVMKPELVVCDESVSALDVSVQAQVLNLLNDLKEHYGFTCLFITHDLSVVHYMADRIMVMQRGRVVECATPERLFAAPQTDYTRTLLAAIPRIE